MKLAEIETTQATGCWAEPYWLEHCDGFRVETATGSLGYVASVDATRRELVVIGDDSATTVAFGSIDAIDPQAESLVVTLRPQVDRA